MEALLLATTYRHKDRGQRSEMIFFFRSVKILRQDLTLTLTFELKKLLGVSGMGGSFSHPEGARAGPSNGNRIRATCIMKIFLAATFKK